MARFQARPSLTLLFFVVFLRCCFLCWTFCSFLFWFMLRLFSPTSQAVTDTTFSFFLLLFFSWFKSVRITKIIYIICEMPE